MPETASRPYTAAILVAAGGSTRMGTPKQLLPLGGMPVIARTLRAFEAAGAIDEIVLVAREEETDALRQIGAAHGVHKLKAIVPGGATRQQSVARGVAAVSGRATLIAIHDGARPLIRPAVIERVVETAAACGAAAAAVPVKDTVKVVDDNRCILSTPDRAHLWNVQTPQVFERALYERALCEAQAAALDFTDDCQLVERLGIAVRLCEADYGNLKITTPEDMAFARGLLEMEGREPV